MKKDSLPDQASLNPSPIAASRLTEDAAKSRFLSDSEEDFFDPKAGERILDPQETTDTLAHLVDPTEEAKSKIAAAACEETELDARTMQAQIYQLTKVRP